MDISIDIDRPGCPKCRGTGYIWSETVPGKRKRCDECDGKGYTGSDD